MRTAVLPDGNPAGIEANAAYYGIGLMVYAVFNLIFLTGFFKTAYKVGNAFLPAIIPATIMVTVMEVLAHIPDLAWLDSVHPGDMTRQMTILAVGFVVYMSATFFTYRIAAARFQRVDLRAAPSVRSVSTVAA